MRLMPDGSLECTLYSSAARRVQVLLFQRPEDAEASHSEDLRRDGDIWRVRIPYRKNLPYYVFRVERDDVPVQPHDPEQWLVDPCAAAVASSRAWGSTDGLTPGIPLKNGAAFPKAVIVKDDYDWSGDQQPDVPWQDTVIYELHVRGFTAHDSSGVSHAGTYRGLIDKIPYLKELGITAVELLPVAEFNEMELYMEDGARKNLRNYWGYNTVAYRAPNARYAADGACGEQVREFRDMVRALHRAGIEIILDVVFNHTAEGDTDWPMIYHFKGIDPAAYYMLSEDQQEYLNFTGCGNTVNANHPAVQDYIIESLRHWVRQYHVDGFRFDLASALCRGEGGAVLEKPPLIERMSHDPVLKNLKLIAEPWDAAGLYHVGSFPGRRWSEWNGRYRDDVREFWNGFTDQPGAFATRLAGSADLYHHHRQGPRKSINFLTCHDGFTLYDLVSYDTKHNEANGENNRDGEQHNFSRAIGRAGPSRDAETEARRIRRVKNMLMTLLLSQGTPMILAGDEFGRTQQGNNNAYCQDNEISWIDWSLLEKNRELFSFTRDLIAFRKQHPALRRTMFLQGRKPEHDHPDIDWLTPDADAPDWNRGRSLAFILHGDSRYTGGHHDSDHILAILHAEDHPAEYRIPAPPDGGAWHEAFCTAKIDWQKQDDRFIVKVPEDCAGIFTAKNKP